MNNSKKKEKKQTVDTNIVKKTLKLWFWSILHFGKWYMPKIPEIKAEELLRKIQSNQAPLLIDIRDESELKKFGYIEDAQMFPYFNFPSQLYKIPEDKEIEIVTICPGGGASLVIAEILISEGYSNVRSLKGGMKNWYKKKYPLIPFDKTKSITQPTSVEEKNPFLKDKLANNYNDVQINLSIDVRNESCPKPVLESKKAIKKMRIGEILEILATDPGSLRDIPAWAVNTKQKFVSYREMGDHYSFLIKKLH